MSLRMADIQPHDGDVGRYSKSMKMSLTEEMSGNIEFFLILIVRTCFASLYRPIIKAQIFYGLGWESNPRIEFPLQTT